MQLANPIRQNLLWVYLKLSVFFFSASFSGDAPVHMSGLYCDHRKSIEPDSFKANFARVVNAIYPAIGKDRQGSYSITSSGTPVYGLAQCYDDVMGVHCQNCFFKAKSLITDCLPYLPGRIYLDGCFFRYDQYDFYDEAVDDKTDFVDCSTTQVDNSSLASFRQRIERLVGKVAEEAWDRDGFAFDSDVNGNVSVYALAQCWKSITMEGCKQCLSEAAKMVKTCPPGIVGRAMLAGCFLRYSNHNSFNVEHSLQDRNDRHSQSWFSPLCLTMSLSVLAFAIVVSSSGCFVYKRLLARRRGGGKLMCSSSHMTNLNFNYEILEKATDCFNESNKLGQGGAGSVFKGILPDGRAVAVKKLFFNTRQWADEFFNEVNLIKGIEHKNLVRLLGCSIEGPESLLVYEYVPNRSLDQILFIKNTIHILSWKQRHEIVLGTAEGLAFLHGESGVKIIHRDIKTSNILLDQSFNPKIADFGLARSVDPSKSHLSTGIAGTLGYLAPEYLVRGQLTEKADVYAFGVLVIEIVCGRKNNAFSGSGSVLHDVWKRFKSNKLPDSVDPGLRGRFPPQEASNVLQIGLLCTQSSTGLRPSMSEVVKMLKDKECVIPSPHQPPFLNASVLSPDDTATSVTDVECLPLNPSGAGAGAGAAAPSTSGCSTPCNEAPEQR